MIKFQESSGFKRLLMQKSINYYASIFFINLHLLG